ncbi:MAG: hypothetical protein M3279_02050 [Actinomycetota bacterium]|nr:hypothetical protein [Actinomycetota bacterium]
MEKQWGDEQVLVTRYGIVLRAFVVALVVLSVSGCGGDDSPTSPAVDLKKNRERWVLPLDEFHGLNYSISDYAEALLIEECMERDGFAYPTGEAKRMDSPPSPTENDVYRSLFDVEIAQQFGYGGPPVEPRTASLTPQELAALESPAGQDAFDRCVEEARKELPLPPDRGLVESLTSASYNAAIEKPEVRKAAEKWRDCMASAGISDLPATPEEMPTDSLRTLWGESVQGEDPTYRPPSPNEIDVAVQDANCQESSGFAQALYDTEWEIQVEMLADNEDGLMRLKAANERHADLVEQVLTARG